MAKPRPKRSRKPAQHVKQEVDVLVRSEPVSYPGSPIKQNLSVPNPPDDGKRFTMRITTCTVEEESGHVISEDTIVRYGLPHAGVSLIEHELVAMLARLRSAGDVVHGLVHVPVSTGHTSFWTTPFGPKAVV